ncbi:MAG: hypothetical protein JOS17DRAFT_571832 [Linnemannia elongata]|nr:MAG: hypothetical protein JOS17DRAFT_571832 [Linnemannia elongata]
MPCLLPTTSCHFLSFIASRFWFYYRPVPLGNRPSKRKNEYLLVLSSLSIVFCLCVYVCMCVCVCVCMHLQYLCFHNAGVFFFVLLLFTIIRYWPSPPSPFF